jgi:hypothetical protein
MQLMIRHNQIEFSGPIGQKKRIYLGNKNGRFGSMCWRKGKIYNAHDLE